MARKTRKKGGDTQRQRSFLQRNKYKLGWWTLFVLSPIFGILLCIWWLPQVEGVNMFYAGMFSVLIGCIVAAFV